MLDRSQILDGGGPKDSSGVKVKPCDLLQVSKPAQTRIMFILIALRVLPTTECGLLKRPVSSRGADCKANHGCQMKHILGRRKIPSFAFLSGSLTTMAQSIGILKILVPVFRGTGIGS